MKKMMTAGLLALVACEYAFAAGPADAFTLYKVSADMDGQTPDWTNGVTYVGGAAPTDLATANVEIDKITVHVTADTFENFAKIGEVSFVEGDDSKCVVDTGAATLSTPGAFYGPGWLVKRGSGSLVLTTQGHIISSDPKKIEDLRCRVDVQEGTLDFGADKLPKPTSGERQTYTWKLRVAEGATYVLAKDCENIVSYEFSGAGTITSPTGSSPNQTKFMPRDNSHFYEFSGVLTENVRLYTSANLYLSGTNSTANGTHIVDGASSLPADGALSLKSLGLRGKPSSIGSSSTINLQEFGGRIRYVGTVPDECDKIFKVVHSSASTGAGVQSCIDGGPYGALTLSGSVGANDSYKIMQRMAFAGSNRNECVFSGSSPVYVRTSGGFFTNRIHVTKTGSGTWRFAHNDTRDGISGVTVKEGILAFDTLAEIGEKCSFGTGLLGFYPDVCEIYDPAKQIPYQFILGDATTNLVGTLALASSNGCVCTTRPIAVAGCGAISNGQATTRLALAGVSPLTDSGKKALILDGVSTADNVLEDVTNDVNGVLSVVKRGTGKWILSGNQTFGGDLRVEGGELVVREASVSQPFSWYRLVLKENWGNYTYGALCDSWAKYAFVLDSKGFALYDVDGQNLAADCVTQVSDYASLGENEGAYMNATRTDQDYRTSAGASKGTNFCAMIKGSNRWVGGGTGSVRPVLSKPETWITLDLRLPAGVAVAAVDFKSQFGYDHKQIDSWSRKSEMQQNCWNYGANIKYFNMYGSSDGVHWEPLFDQDVYCEGTNYNPNAWFFGNNYTNGVAKGLKFDHTVSSRAAATVLPNVGTVSVANGGVLRVEGEPITIRSLEVDPQSGGTISNVAFAAEGTLVVSKNLEGNDIALPGTYQDVSGFEDIAANWTLDAGKKSRSYTIVNKNGILHLVKKGLMIIFR